MSWDTKDNYPDNWDEIREQVLERDGHECTNCGDDDSELHVHHITPLSEGGSHALANLTTLCHYCHERVHGHAIPTMGSSDYSYYTCRNRVKGEYKCIRCKRAVSLAKRGVRCPYCGQRILIKEASRVIRSVDVR